MGKLYYPFDEVVSEDIRETARNLRSKRKKIVLAGGTFDVEGGPHSVHIQFLRSCRDLGDVLFVNVTNHDRAVQYKRGDKDKDVPRPYLSEHARAFGVSAIDAVDYATVYPYVGNPYDSEDIGPTERLALIVRPHIFVKGIQNDGSGWEEEKKSRIRALLKYNPKFEEIRIDGDISSTSILEYRNRIRQGLQTIIFPSLQADLV